MCNRPMRTSRYVSFQAKSELIGHNLYIKIAVAELPILPKLPF